VDRAMAPAPSNATSNLLFMSFLSSWCLDTAQIRAGTAYVKALSGLSGQAEYDRFRSIQAAARCVNATTAGRKTVK
jgi:hypothetical protein